MDQFLGKIYRLDAPDGTFYIGSTKQSLIRRLTTHKSFAKNKTTKVYTHFNQLGWDNITINLIEEINCNTEHDLRIRENQEIENHISNPLCLNSYRSAGFNKQEYMKDYHKDYNKSYREKNRDRLNTYLKEYREKKKLHQSTGNHKVDGMK